jgi:hypothetical protein
MGMRRMVGGVITLFAAAVATLGLALGASAHAAPQRASLLIPAHVTPRSFAAPGVLHLKLAAPLGGLPQLTLQEVLSGHLPPLPSFGVLGVRRLPFRVPLLRVPRGMGHGCFVAGSSLSTPDCDARPSRKFIGAGLATDPAAATDEVAPTLSDTR